MDNALSDDDLTVVENDPAENDPAEEQSGSLNDAAVVAAPNTDADGPVLVIDLSDTDEGRPAGGPALLFTNVAGADFPLVTNLFGTARRADIAGWPAAGWAFRRRDAGP